MASRLLEIDPWDTTEHVVSMKRFVPQPPGALPPPLPKRTEAPAPAQTAVSKEAIAAEMIAEVRSAASLQKPIKSAARTAWWSAISTLTIGILALVSSVMDPDWTVLIGVGVTAVGVVEFIGHKRMLQAHPSAARMLGFNQIAFLCIICAYCLAQMYLFSVGKGSASAMNAQLGPAADAMPGLVSAMPLIVYGLYGSVMVVSLASQGLLALYYFRRHEPLQTFGRQVSDPVRRLLTEMQK